jgi:uncharacterized protein YbjT (DUF2867 family)
MPLALRSLLLAGSTGLVGRALLAQALARPDLQAVHRLLRRPPAEPSGPAADARVRSWVVDFRALPALPAADGALCALGTTIKAAGSQAAFRAVDHDAVLAFARAARDAGASRFGLVSALGADARSRVFYNRVKGETEDAVRALGFTTLVIARPSLLLGDRRALGQPARRGEALGQRLAAPLGALLPAAWRPIEAQVVARALLRSLATAGAGVQVLESGRLHELGAP